MGAFTYNDDHLHSIFNLVTITQRPAICSGNQSALELSHIRSRGFLSRAPSCVHKECVQNAQRVPFPFHSSGMDLKRGADKRAALDRSDLEHADVSTVFPQAF